jgi:hypothetical protein
MRPLLITIALLALASTTSVSIATSVVAPLHDVIVAEDDEFDGVRFPTGSIASVQDSDGSLSSIILAADFMIGTYTILKGTDLRWAGRDGIGFCFGSRENQTLGEINLAKDSWVCLDPAGLLIQIYLKGAIVFEDVPLAAETLVKFHSNGKVKSGVLSMNVEIQAVQLPIGSEVSFFDTGVLECASLTQTAVLDGLRFMHWSGSGCDLDFWPNGKLKRAALAETTTIGAVTCARYFPAEWSESGELLKCSQP